MLWTESVGSLRTCSLQRLVQGMHIRFRFKRGLAFELVVVKETGPQITCSVHRQRTKCCAPDRCSFCKRSTITSHRHLMVSAVVCFAILSRQWSYLEHVHTVGHLRRQGHVNRLQQNISVSWWSIWGQARTLLINKCITPSRPCFCAHGLKILLTVQQSKHQWWVQRDCRNLKALRSK